MSLLTKLHTCIRNVPKRVLHRTASLKSKDEKWNEREFLLRDKPWENFSPRLCTGFVPDPYPILLERCDEPHGLILIPYAYAMLFLIVIPMSIYAWYTEYQHLFAHRKRRPWPPYEFLHVPGYKALPWGDGRHSLMHHPYWNFLPEGYETDQDGNMLPPGVYVKE